MIINRKGFHGGDIDRRLGFRWGEERGWVLLPSWFFSLGICIQQQFDGSLEAQCQTASSAADINICIGLKGIEVPFWHEFWLRV